MRHPVPLPRHLWGRSFGVDEAREAGLGHSTLQSSRLSRPFWGIRAEFDPAGIELIRAFAPRMPARAFFYGTTAALLHELPLPTRLSRAVLPLHVAVPAGLRRIAAKDIAAHHVAIHPRDVVLVDDLRTTGIERTWCDLSACGLSVAELVAAGDAALSFRRPRTQIRRLRAAAARYDGRRGARLIRDALPLLSDRSDSAPESELRVTFALAGLLSPQVNRPINHHGRLVATPDLSWPECRVIVEYEGDHHRTDPRQWSYDIERYAMLQELGWTVIRATAADYRDSTRLIARVARALSIRR